MITGALGHIGSKLIHSIKPNEFKKVYLLDNLLTQRYSSLFDLPIGVDYKFIEGDILKTNLIDKLKDVDVVVHLAAITDAPSSFDRPELVEEVNYKGTKRIAEACIETDTRLLFPSTTSVYGTQSKTVDENCLIDELKPQSPYAEYKLKSEDMLRNMGKKNSLNYITCRFGTIFGTSIGMRFHTAVNKFCWQAVMGIPLTVWETAMDQKRPYLGVNDSVSSIKFIITNNLFNGEIYNIVSTNSTVREIINNIKNYIPKLKIDFVDSEIMNQLSYNVSFQKILAEGFKPKESLLNGIGKTLSLIKNNINN